MQRKIKQRVSYKGAPPDNVKQQRGGEGVKEEGRDEEELSLHLVHTSPEYAILDSHLQLQGYCLPLLRSHLTCDVMWLHLSLFVHHVPSGGPTDHRPGVHRASRTDFNDWVRS